VSRLRPARPTRQPGTIRLGTALIALVGAAALAAAGCGGESVKAQSLPLDEKFDDCDAGFSMNDEVSTVECTGGRLRILVAKPEISALHYVPFRFDPSVTGLSVRSTVRLQKGRGYFGIGCDASTIGEGARGYLFVLQSDLDAAAILRLDETATLPWIAFRRLDVDPARPHRLEATCTPAANGATALRLAVDDRVVLEKVDEEGIGPFRTALAAVIAHAPGTEVRLDALSAARADARPLDVTPAANPAAYRYRIDAIGYDGRPIRKVSLGDEFLVVVSAPELPRDREVPFRLCVNHGARLACSDDRLDGGSETLSGWTVDPGEEVDGRLRLSVHVKGREVASTSAALGG
jgi:hypothetical protein